MRVYIYSYINIWQYIWWRGVYIYVPISLIIVSNFFFSKDLLECHETSGTSFSAFNFYFINLYFLLCLFQEIWGLMFFGNWSQIQFFGAFIFLLNICGFLENISVLISFLTLAYLSYLRGKKILELVKNIIIFKSCSVHTIIVRIKLLSNRTLLCLLSVIFSTGWLENPQ